MLRRSLITHPVNAARLLSVAPSRSLHCTPIAREPPNKPEAATTTTTTEATEQADEGAAPVRGSLLGSIFYGSEKARAEGDVKLSDHQHSKIIGRGKYVHEKITHAVHPGHRDEYLAAAEKYFATLVQDSPHLGGVKLCGSWETIIGSVGNFVHILEYEGHAGYDETRRTSLKNQALQGHLKEVLKHVDSRQHQLISEFSFFPSSPPHDSGYPDGGIFELRTYQLLPGKLLEWEYAWRRGLEARKRFVQPVGAFYSQVGQLHEVHHIWQYPDMATRKATREKAWTIGNWSHTVQETGRLTSSMKSTIMVPTKWSPLR